MRVKAVGLLLGAALSSAGCGSRDPDPSDPPEVLDHCASEADQEDRRDFLDRVGLPPRRPAPPVVQRGETIRGEGFTITFVSWEHGVTEGDRVRGLWLEPDPLPPEPLPLLVNVPGHWEAGVEADEVLYRSELFARQGWAVLSVATRGTELGDAPVPPWRAAHFSEGLYGEMRGRRTGTSPSAWNVVAAWGGTDSALAGRFSDAVIERDVLAVVGFSGGAELATLVAATDPRVGGVVIGSFEYAFGSNDGASSCSCGALPGGWERPTQARWLGHAACRPGAPPRARPVLAWDGQPELGLTSELERRGAVVRSSGGLHGVNHPMAAASWSFLESHLRGAAVTASDEDAARAVTSASWLPIDAATRPPLDPTLPVPGRASQGGAPWLAPFGADAGTAAALLGLTGGGDPAGDWFGLGDRSVAVARSSGRPDGRGWVVVSIDTPLRETPEPFDYAEPLGAGASGELVGRLDRAASVAFVRPRTSGDQAMDERLARWAAEHGVAPLGVAVRDALDAADLLAARPEVDPARIGFVGVGAGGVAAAWAALLRGGEEPVVLVDAPATLWWDGPESGDDAAILRPWPVSLLSPIRQGAALDPWPAAAALGSRVRWVDPRGGDGRPWAGRSLPGEVFESLETALAR